MNGESEWRLERPFVPRTTREKIQDFSQAWVSYNVAPAPKPNMTKDEPMTTEHELLTRVTARPDVFGDKPIIRDMRISVELILSLLAQGVSHGAILDDYPDLEAGGYSRLQRIRACGNRRRHAGRRLGQEYMKFLIDRCAGRRLADWLPAAGTMSWEPETRS